MDRLVCEDLEKVREYKLSQYIETRSASYYRVSTDLAAYKNVDMGALGAIWKHQLICVSALS